MCRLCFYGRGNFSGGVLGFSGRVHNLVYGSRVPFHTILLLYRIKHFYLLYDTLHPASHNFLMDNKEVWARPGMMCACVAALGGHGRSNFSVCIYCSALPCGRCMTRGRIDGLIFLSGYPGRIKCPFSPASAIDWLVSIFILDVLNSVSCFGDSMISMEESSVSGSIWSVVSSLQVLWIVVLSSSSSSS